MLNPFLLFAKLYLLRFCSYRPKSKMAPADVLENFKWRYLLNGSSNLLHVWFYDGVFGIGGSTGTICVSIKSKMTPTEDICITKFFITWKNSSPMNTSQRYCRFTVSHHEYTLSEPSAVVHGTDWLHLDTFRPMEHAQSQTTRLLNTWKDGFAIKASQHSGHLYWIKPWIHTFWAQISGKY